MATVTPLEVVREWVSAVNALDVPAVMSRSSSDIELGGPRGLAFYMQRVALEGSRPVIQKLLGK